MYLQSIIAAFFFRNHVSKLSCTAIRAIFITRAVGLTVGIGSSAFLYKTENTAEIRKFSKRTNKTKFYKVPNSRQNA